MLQHARLGHLADSRLDFMQRHNTACDLPPVKLFKNFNMRCDICTVGSRNRAPFHSSREKGVDIIQMLHFDVAEISPPHLKKYYYALVTVCQATRYSWVRLLENKSDALVEGTIHDA